jgi:hypothetical protein
MPQGGFVAQGSQHQYGASAWQQDLQSTWNEQRTVMHLYGLYSKFSSDGAQSRWNHAVHDAHQKADELKQIRPQVIRWESEAQVIW